MKLKLKIVNFSVFFCVCLCVSSAGLCADQKLNIDLDMEENFRTSNVKGDLQLKLEDLDKKRTVKSLEGDEWLKFHRNDEFTKHTPGNSGNRAMADEIKNSAKYKGTNLDPLANNDEFESFGLKGKIDLN